MDKKPTSKDKEKKVTTTPKKKDPVQENEEAMSKSREEQMKILQGTAGKAKK